MARPLSPEAQMVQSLAKIEEQLKKLDDLVQIRAHLFEIDRKTKDSPGQSA